ncbi:hypothetical protein D9M71_723080 [compost metagenome]
MSAKARYHPFFSFRSSSLGVSAPVMGNNESRQSKSAPQVAFSADSQGESLGLSFSMKKWLETLLAAT